MVINDYSNLTMAPFQGSSCPATSSCQGIARELLSIITWEKAWRKVNFQKLVKIWPPLRHSVRKCAVRFSGAINEAKMEAPQKHRKTGPGGGFFGVEKNFVAWTAWWFQTFFYFLYVGNNPSHWRTHIFQTSELYELIWSYMFVYDTYNNLISIVTLDWFCREN